ncbi:MAG TPA: CPBP family intramembrane glutamic endopeptidase [Candidatus Acidoferrum sp.]|nr:CPBP family intramembrane glutamic endopeptidase [Candidatus Acidoferrum sp.]
MSGERLTGSEKRALLFWVVLGIAGAVFARHYFFRAFPEASVDFRVSRGEARARAQRFASSLGEDVRSYQSAIIFDVDDNAKTYLERELGLQQANRVLSSELHIWYWDVRFFRPQQEEEFHVRVSPAGEIVGYSHKVEESRAGASLDRTAAQTVAQNFLSGKLGIDLNAWDFLPEEANSKKKPNRLDWDFTWEKRGFRAKDAPYRLQVTLEGNRPGGSKEFLQVPEAWERSYTRLRSSNDTLTLVFIIPYLALLGAAIWLAARLTNRGQTSWRGAIWLGAVVAVMLFLQNLNDWPLWSASYDTKDSYGNFLALKLGAALLFSVVTAIPIALVLPGGEPLYRASQPGRLRLSKTFTWRGLRSKEFFSSAVVGLSMAAAHIGYVVAFYLVASHFGAWAPQELNYEESVNTAFPWISGAAIGLLASTNEEFTFRLFAIPFFARLTRSRWIAVIVPAFLWSFLHSNYPQEPAYIRGIEIGLFGIVAGMVMLRWGILATLIWHYTVDASLVGLFLLRSNSLYFKASGAIVAAAAAAPLVFAGISYLVRGRFEPDEDLLNSAAPAPDISLAAAPRSTSATDATRRYDALAPGMIGFLAVCLVAGSLIIWRLKPESIGDYLKLSVNAKSARARADEIMRRRGMDPNSYLQATVFVNVTDPITNEFLRERVGIARMNEIYATQVPGAVWQVRYFRDSQTEEYSIKLKPDGSLLAIHHRLAEDAPGASLSKEEAVARAEQFLRDEKKIDLSQWSLVEAESDKRRHRIDHELTWQQNAPIDSRSTSPADAMGHAYVRIKVAVLGDEVTDYRAAYYPKSESREELEQKEGGTYWIFIKIPDEWRRKQGEQTLPRTILNYGIPLLILAGGGITALVLFLKNFRSEAARSIPWKRLSRWAMWGLVAFFLVFALGNTIPMRLNLYDTAIPFKTMLGIIGISALFGGPFEFGLLLAVFGVAWYYARRAFGEEKLPSWTGMPAQYYSDALLISLGGAAGVLGLQTLLQMALRHWPTAHRFAEARIGSNFDAILPAASTLGATLWHSLLYTGFVALVASFVAAQLRSRWMHFLLFLLGTLALVGGAWGSAADFAEQWLAQAILLSALVFGVRRVMRFNILGCFLLLATTSLVREASPLLRQPDAFYRANGYAILLALFLLLAWPFMAWRMQTAANA